MHELKNQVEYWYDCVIRGRQLPGIIRLTDVATTAHRIVQLLDLCGPVQEQILRMDWTSVHYKDFDNVQNLNQLLV